jgi:hypothetical protein
MELLSEHSILEYDEENDLLAGLLVHILVQNPQRRVSLGRLLEHNFFKFAGCPPQSGISIRNPTPAESNHRQGYRIINASQQGPSTDIDSAGLENGDAERSTPMSNSPRPSQGKRALRPTTGQALRPS